MIDKDLRMWIDEQVILYLDIWGNIMYNAPINRKDEEWLNQKRFSFDEYIKDVKEENLPIEVLNPKEHIPSYIEELKKRYVQIMMRKINIEIKKSKDYAKKRVEEIYSTENKERS